VLGDGEQHLAHLLESEPFRLGRGAAGDQGQVEDVDVDAHVDLAALG
jgi:hypothetical protein